MHSIDLCRKTVWKFGLKRLVVENTGPIAEFQLELPFHDGNPQPLVLVGPNGSGKSTLLSFIVNALIAFKQQAFEQVEVEHNRVYRVRSSSFIRTGAHWYHAEVEFAEGLSLIEWVLDRPKRIFEAEINPLPTDNGWKSISDEEAGQFLPSPPYQHPLDRKSKPIRKLFGENVVLFFPSDRFELPNWLNEGSLVPALRFPEPVMIEGQTARRIFSRGLLRPTLEWIKAVALDTLLSDYTPRSNPSTDDARNEAQFHRGGPNIRIIDFVCQVLARILGADSDNMRLQFTQRNIGTIAVEYNRLGRRESIPNLLGLSAGQAALFCIFTNVIRDFDLAGTPFNNVFDIRGIVIIDEADLHLHVDLQYRVLPQLIQLFPRVQFIITAHSPLFVMGMEKTYGDNFKVIALPTGHRIESETFSEFERALEAFSRTRAFDQRVLDQIRASAKPVIIVEGKSDAAHLEKAWEKLHPGNPMPWAVVPCGGSSSNEGRGGAEMLRTMLRALCLYVERPTLGIFDHDREGVEQFMGLKADGFQQATDRMHWKHSQQPVHSLLLPVPPSREKFVSVKARSCFLAIEHFYSDDLLQRHGVADEPVVADSIVFGITTDSRKKTRLVDALPDLDVIEFANFKLLFERLAEVLATPLMSEEVESSAADPLLHASSNAVTTAVRMPVTACFDTAGTQDSDPASLSPINQPELPNAKEQCQRESILK